MRSSAIFLVSVVTSTRWSLSVRDADLADEVVDLALRRAAPAPRGRSRPVGRTICSTTWVDTSISYALGVADRNTTWLTFVHELLERSGRLSHRRRQAEPVLDEGVLAGAVALVLAVELRHGDVRLVDDDEVVVGEVVEQRVGHLPAARPSR